MNILKFGDNTKPAILFFQGSMTHWSWYEAAIQELAKQFYIIVPILKGHNGKELPNEDFVSIEESVSEIEDFLLKNGYSQLMGAYGLSIGGGMISYMIANDRIKIEKAIIDGGITPYQYPYFYTRLILLRDFLAIKLLQNSRKVLKHFFNMDKYELTKEEVQEYYNEVSSFLKTVSNKTIKNIFDSANNYTMPSPIPKISTNITYWVGEKEETNRKRDIKYILSAFPNTIVSKIDGMEHGELVTMMPAEFSKRAISFFEKEI